MKDIFNSLNYHDDMMKSLNPTISEYDPLNIQKTVMESLSPTINPLEFLNNHKSMIGYSETAKTALNLLSDNQNSFKNMHPINEILKANDTIFNVLENIKSSNNVLSLFSGIHDIEQLLNPMKDFTDFYKSNENLMKSITPNEVSLFLEEKENSLLVNAVVEKTIKDIINGKQENIVEVIIREPDKFIPVEKKMIYKKSLWNRFKDIFAILSFLLTTYQFYLNQNEQKQIIFQMEKKFEILLKEIKKNKQEKIENTIKYVSKNFLEVRETKNRNSKIIGY
jgi:hypothetical protein